MHAGFPRDWKVLKCVVESLWKEPGSLKVLEFRLWCPQKCFSCHTALTNCSYTSRSPFCPITAVHSVWTTKARVLIINLQMWGHGPGSGTSVRSTSWSTENWGRGADPPEAEQFLLSDKRLYVLPFLRMIYRYVVILWISPATWVVLNPDYVQHARCGRLPVAHCCRIRPRVHLCSISCHR